MTEIFGNIRRNEKLLAAFSTALESLWAKGTRETLNDYTGGHE